MYKLLILVYINYAAAALESRIVNGRDARPGEFGYIVSVQEFFYEFYHKCGGSIINEYNVLSAASCFEPHSNVHFIQYGVVKIVPNYINVIHVRIVHIHEEFNAMDFNLHDIAILRLSSPLPFDSPSVTPISLPTQGQEFKERTWARIAGWGSVDDADGAPSEHLQTAIVYMVKCQIYCSWCFHKKSQICANNRERETRRGACIGDLGSPLVKMIKGRKMLAGLYSRSYDGKCVFGYYPDVFTKVSHYVNWIEEQLKMSI